jgi:hypothetical protein
MTNGCCICFLKEELTWTYNNWKNSTRGSLQQQSPLDVSLIIISLFFLTAGKVIAAWHFIFKVTEPLPSCISSDPRGLTDPVFLSLLLLDSGDRRINILSPCLFKMGILEHTKHTGHHSFVALETASNHTSSQRKLSAWRPHCHYWPWLGATTCFSISSLPLSFLTCCPVKLRPQAQH